MHMKVVYSSQTGNSILGDEFQNALNRLLSHVSCGREEDSFQKLQDRYQVGNPRTRSRCSLDRSYISAVAKLCAN